MIRVPVMLDLIPQLSNFSLVALTGCASSLTDSGDFICIFVHGNFVGAAKISCMHALIVHAYSLWLLFCGLVRALAWFCVSSISSVGELVVRQLERRAAEHACATRARRDLFNHAFPDLCGTAVVLHTPSCAVTTDTRGQHTDPKGLTIATRKCCCFPNTIDSHPVVPPPRTRCFIAISGTCCHTPNWEDRQKTKKR